MATIPGYLSGVRRKTLFWDPRSVVPERLDPVAALVRRHDRDRFQTVLLAPAAAREALFALYAFNYEIARVRESVAEPPLGQIRLEWWREAVDAAFAGGPVPRHDVIEALTIAIRGHSLSRRHFERLIDARTADFDDQPPATLAALEDYAEATSSGLIYLALEVFGVRDGAVFEAARHIGIAYALSGLLRSFAFLAAIGRVPIPDEIAFRTGLDRSDRRPQRSSPALRAASAEIGAAALSHLESGRHPVSAAAFPALLPGVIARHSLRRLTRAAWDPLDPSLSRRDPLQSWRLAIAATRGRL